MQVPREDEVERPGGNPVDDAGEVAEQQAKARPGAFELVRLRPSRPVALRVDADDRHRGSPQRDRLDLVAQQGRALEVVELRGPRERIARDGDVVVAENDERVVEDVQQLTQPSLAARMRDEVPGDADDVRPPLRDPRRRPPARAVAARQAAHRGGSRRDGRCERRPTRPDSPSTGRRGRAFAASRPRTSRRRRRRARRRRGRQGRSEHPGTVVTERLPPADGSIRPDYSACMGRDAQR